MKNNNEFGTMNERIGMSQEAKASSQAAARKYRNQNQTGPRNTAQYNYEFATGAPYQGMSKEAKDSSKAAAQKYRSQTQGQNSYSTEFGSFGFAQKGYQAMGQEAKQGTLAAKNQAYKNEFGSSNSDFQARSQQAAKQMRNYTPSSQMQSKFSTEFASANGFAQKGYQAMGQEAKQGTLAAKNQAYKNEFGSSNSDFQARSQIAAQQMRSSQPRQNSKYSMEFASGNGFAQRGYNAMGQEGKQGTIAARNQQSGNSDNRARSQAAAQMNNQSK
jgi:hypothetical protein